MEENHSQPEPGLTQPDPGMTQPDPGMTQPDPGMTQPDPVTVKKTLCEPGICRIFFSSPFNGMEGEREELTRRYWPQIASLCNSRGLQFVPVDMRWGITSELSDDAQTINICLREIDRSDMFIGFFGQRYGWHGEEDEALQKNFEAAFANYPWLEQYRDRSVTELEFLHGHLLRPGNIPSFICFRDKAWDDKERQIGVENANKRTIYKYSPESAVAVVRMDDLKLRVKVTENLCLGVNLAYADPKEGARMMFEAIWQYLTEVLLKDSTSRQQTIREAQLQEHNTFSNTRSSVFVGGEQHHSYLNQYISQASPQPLVLQGVSGVGKTAVLSTWIRHLQKSDPDGFLVYHFVGSTPQSREFKNILQRIVGNLCYQLEGEEPHRDYGSMEVKDLVQAWLKVIRQITSQGHKVKVIIDGLDKINHGLKVSKPFYWIPEELPTNLYLVCSTSPDDTVSEDELVKARGWQTHLLEPLQLDTRTAMCKALLMLRGKELSATQTETIVSANQTQNPLFLKILLEELCNFGRFRELDKKIGLMMTSETPQELFEKFLERCENDYNNKDYPGNMVAKVLSAVSVSRYGLSERELKEMFDIPTNIWTPLYYGINKFIVSRNGFIGFAYSELGDAVYKRYIGDHKAMCEVLMLQIKYYMEQYQRYVNVAESVPSRYDTELPWLCYKGKLHAKLLEVLQLPTIFQWVLSQDKYQLLQYIQELELSTEQFIEAFTLSLRLHVVDVYSKDLEHLQDSPIVTDVLIRDLGCLIDFLSFAHYHKILEHFLLWKKKILDNCRHLDEHQKLKELMANCYKLGCLYADLNEWNKSLEYHTVRLNHFQSLDRTPEIWQELGLSHHGQGLAYTGLAEFTQKILYTTKEKIDELYEQAEKHFRKSIDAHEKSGYDGVKELVSKSLSCIAEISSKQGDFEEAVKQYEDVLKMQEDIYYGELPIELSYTMSNLGICYRKLNQLDKAFDLYTRSMRIKQMALGWYHTDVAIGCSNLSRYYSHLEDHAMEEKYLKDAVDIYDFLGEGDTMSAVMVKENLCLNAFKQNSQEKMREYEPYFWQAFDYLSANGELDKCIPVLHSEYIKMFMSDRNMRKVRKLAEAYVKIPKLRSSFVFCYLAYLDHMYPPEGGAPPRPYEQTVDFALTLFPGTMDLIHSKFEFEVIPARDLDAIKPLMNNYYDHSQSDTEGFIIETSLMFQIFGWPEGEIKLLELGLEKFPGNVAVLKTLAKSHYKLNNLERALYFMEESHRIDPTDVIILTFIVTMSLMVQCDIDKGRKYMEELRQKWGDEPKTKETIVRMEAHIQEMEANKEKTQTEHPQSSA